MKQNCFQARLRHALCILTGLFILTFFSTGAQAAPFELIYNGYLNTQDALNPASQSNPTYFADLTPFTISAFFDASSPNLAPSSPPAPPPFAGFRAYSPSLVTISIGGQVYTMDNFTANPTAGVTVAIFDRNSFTPGRYAIGILQQPPQDGAGIIGDFAGASPDFTADTLTSTTFTGYSGVGYGSGVCLQGTGANCQVSAVTPFVLHDSLNQTWALTLGNYDEAYPGGDDAGSSGRIPGPLNQAQLVATPEPGTLGVMGAALAIGLGFARRRHS
jgi:hypothetical protein